MSVRLLIPILFASVLAAPSSAQIVAVYLKGKVSKTLAKHAVELEGGLAVVGEPKSGIRYDPDARQIQYSGDGPNELYVADPAKPQDVPYEIRKGERRERSKKNVVSINGRDIDRIVMLMVDESLLGLSKEYKLRSSQIDELREARDALDKTTAAWAARHLRLVTAMARLEGWLARTGFTKAAEDLTKGRKKIEKKTRDAALRARSEKALAAIKSCGPPEDLVSLAEEISGGNDKFLAFQSQHMRVYFIDEIEASRVKEAMHLGEEVIEGFRAEFVDPYLADDYLDTIPDDIIVEWLFVPDVDERYEAYTTRYWSVSWTRDREERLAMGGGRMEGGPSRPYRFYRKNRDLDLDALFCHDLGHTLCGVHYGGARQALRQDWLSEGVAYYISFEFLGRNGVTCKAFDVERSGYVKRQAKRDQGEKTIGIARRELYNEVALKAGRPIEQLALRDLVVMDDADLAKSWSFFDYIARKEGEAGQRWLRSAGRHGWETSTFIAKWREDATKILGVDPSRAFKDVEERWKAFATMDQEIGEKTRKRR